MRPHRRFVALVSLAFAALGAGAATRVVQDQCGPFTDVSPTFCPYVLEMYYLGITAGTSPTTYSPDNPVTRGQAAVFVSKGVNQAIARSSRRAALGQWWTPKTPEAIGLTAVGMRPLRPASDGGDVWVPNIDSGTVSRIRASDGKLLETWTGAVNATGALVAMGRVFVTGQTDPGRLYMIDPSQPPGDVVTVASDLGNAPMGIAFDGSRIWTANYGGSSVSIVQPGATIPWTVTTVASAYSNLRGIVYDGANIWVTSSGSGYLLKLDSAGAVVQPVFVDSNPGDPVYDGANLWVPNTSNSVHVVRAATGSILATLKGNGVGYGTSAAFDGERIAVTGYASDTLSLWRAADLTPLGSTFLGVNTAPIGVCSDGVNFWVTLSDTGQLARF